MAKKKDKKKVLCSYEKCGIGRSDYGDRPRMECEIDADYEGEYFCSITCACMAGFYHVRKGWIQDPTHGKDPSIKVWVRPSRGGYILHYIETMTKFYKNFGVCVNDNLAKEAEESWENYKREVIET